MSEASQPASNGPEQPPEEELIPTSDPYPRMILVCMGIFVVLIIVIFGFILYDFMHEQDARPPVRQINRSESTPKAPAAP